MNSLGFFGNSLIFVVNGGKVGEEVSPSRITCGNEVGGTIILRWLGLALFIGAFMGYEGGDMNGRGILPFIDVSACK